MTREDFYHSRPMTFLQRLVSIGYGTCGCCGMPWNFVRKHGGEHTIMINKYEGFFPVCEYCWTRKSYRQNESAVTELIKKWREQGGIEYKPNVYSNAFEDDWNKTHNNETFLTKFASNMKTKTIPFDLETAKKIQAGEIKGRIVQANGFPADILAYNINGSNLAVRFTREDGSEGVDEYQPNGKAQAEWCSDSEEFALAIELSEEVPNIIDSKSLYEKWADIQDSLIELFREKAVKNNVKFSDADLVHYAAELFTWFRETHLIFKFRLDKLEELKQYAEKHIMEPSWCSETKQNIKKIFGLESPKHEFKPFEKVLVKPYDMSESMEDVNCWRVDVFSHIDKYTGDYVCIGGLANPKYTLPYEGNEHLVGTTDKPKEE